MSKDELLKLGLSSREELAEELVLSRRAAIGEFRNDEGTTFDDNYYAFWKRYRLIENLAKKMNITWSEIEEAKQRHKRGIPASKYGIENIFLPQVEWLTRILDSGRPHLGGAERCINEWAGIFLRQTDVSLNDRIRMTLNCKTIINRWRKEVGIVSFYPLYQALEKAIERASSECENVDLPLAERLINLLIGHDQWRNDENLDLIRNLDRLALAQPPSQSIHQTIASLEQMLKEAKHKRTFKACDQVRTALENAIPIGKDRLREIFFAYQHISEIAFQLIWFILDCASEWTVKGDYDKSQEFWVLALSISEMFKSPLTGRFLLLLSGIGESVRHRWPKRIAEPFSVESVTKASDFTQGTRNQRRVCRSASSKQFQEWSRHWFRDVGKIIKRDESFTGPCAKPSFKRFVIVDYKLLDNNLVAFLDGNIERFIYGDNFKDYGYTPDKVLPAPLVGPPVVKYGVKKELLHAVATLNRFTHGKSSLKGNTKTFVKSMERLSELLGMDEIEDALSRHCEKLGQPKKDLSIIIIPDGILYHIPWAFLRGTSGDPLIQHFGSISTAFSFLSLKWQVMSYLWRCLPFLNAKTLRCVFVGSPATNVENGLNFLPGVIEEWNVLRSIFGDKHVLGFGDATSEDFRANLNNIATYHHDAEAFWFSGHGIAEEKTPLTIGGVELPRVGMMLPDGVLTSSFFHRGKPWNFHRSWMVVLNACLLGKLYERGSEMMGLLTSLHLVGARSIASCLWSVSDEVAVNFAREFSQHLVVAYANKELLEKEFVKAKAFCDTLRILLQQYDENEVACYFYAGSP